MKIARLLLLTVLLAATSARSTAADWPQWRGPDQNGISKETGWSTTWPANGPKQLWKAQVGVGYSAFSVSNGRVYTTGNNKDTETIFCLDANTGAERWKHSFDSKLDAKYYDGGTSATPTVEDGKVYTISKRGLVHCLDAAKGTILWSKNLAEELKAEIPTWGFAGSVTIVGDTAMLNVGTAGTALEKKTGKVIWTSGKEASGYSTPVIFDAKGERAAMFTIKQGAVAVKVADGKELWRVPWVTQYDVNAADPILSGSKVFVSSGYNHGGGVFDVGVQPAKEVWNNKNMRNQMATSVLWDGNLYGMDDNQLRCIVFETGELKWTDKISGKGSLMIADGKLLVLTERGELLVAKPSPDGFKPIARAQVLGGKCWTAPVLANGKIYCRNATGQAVCVDVGGK
jgi:outer membrane protein assembly factor BamB